MADVSTTLACSRLRDGGGKSFSNKKCEKRAGVGERQGTILSERLAQATTTCAVVIFRVEVSCITSVDGILKL